MIGPAVKLTDSHEYL